MSLVQTDYEQLLELRTGLRRFLRWSERQAQAVGITAAQHQLLLAIRGHPGDDGPTIGDVAGYLVLRHHSAVGLVDRAAAVGLVRREPDPTNASVIRLSLTDDGMEKLQDLSQAHLDELQHLAPAMRALWQALEPDGAARTELGGTSDDHRFFTSDGASGPNRDPSLAIRPGHARARARS